MLADILLILVALIALLIASISDWKTKEVPDFASYGLIIAALGIRLLHSLITSEWMYFIYGLVGLASMFLLGSVIYYARQWGGGDAKLLMGLGAAFFTRPFYFPETLPYQMPFLLTILANLFIVGAAYGILWSLVIFLKNWKKSVKAMGQILRGKRNLQFVVVGTAVLLLITSFAFDDFTRLFLMSLVVFAIVYLYLYFFIKASEKIGMYHHISVGRLREGDWLAEDIIIGNKVVCRKDGLGLTRNQIKRIRKSKLKKVLVKEGLAFVPSILLSVVVSLVFGNVFLYLV